MCLGLVSLMRERERERERERKKERERDGKTETKRIESRLKYRLHIDVMRKDMTDRLMAVMLASELGNM